MHHSQSCLRTCHPPGPQDPHNLYFLFDLMPGGDLMDVLVAEAKIIKHPVPQKGSVRQGVLSPKVKMWQVRPHSLMVPLAQRQCSWMTRQLFSRLPAQASL